MHAFCSGDNGIGVFQIRAIAYVSHKIVNGNIRQEYVERMKLAIHDAQALGVDSRYLNAAVWPFILGPIMQPVGEQQASREQGLAYSTQESAYMRQGRQISPLEPGMSEAEHLQRYNQNLEYATACDARKERKRQEQALKKFPPELAEQDGPNTGDFNQKYEPSDIPLPPNRSPPAIGSVPTTKKGEHQHREAERPESGCESSGLDVADVSNSEGSPEAVSGTGCAQQKL